jgi:hypothetical protein
MTLKMFVFSRSRELLAGVLIALPGPGSLSGQVVIDISTHRPLAAALDSLQNQLGIPINYEDVPYQNPADLEDVSNPEKRAKYPGFHLLVPRTGRVNGNIDLNGDAVAGIETLLGSYRANGLPGDFRAERANGMIYVSATKVRTVAGTVVDVASPFNTVIAVPEENRSISKTIVFILDSVYKASGTHIALGDLHFYPGQTITFGAPQAPARDILAALFTKAARSVPCYRLLYGPRTGYMLNIQRVLAASGPANAGSPVPSKPAPAATGIPGVRKR